MTITDTPAGRYRIAEIARLSGFSASALRYYEQAGILAPPERTSSGYRVYGDRDLERLRLIARAKDLGCTLEKIGQLVEAWDGDECAPVKHRLRSLVLDKVAEVDAHLAQQTEFAGQLRATAAALATRPLDGPCDDSCGCTTSAEASLTDGCGAECWCSSASDTAVVALGRTTAREPEPGGPIACSLAGADMTGRIEDWQRLLDRVTGREELRDGLRLRFADRTLIGELAGLVDAEQSCCAFFAFAITLDHRGLALEVTAPPAGQDLLTTIFGDHR